MANTKMHTRTQIIIESDDATGMMQVFVRVQHRLPVMTETFQVVRGEPAVLSDGNSSWPEFFVIRDEFMRRGPDDKYVPVYLYGRIVRPTQVSFQPSEVPDVVDRVTDIWSMQRYLAILGADVYEQFGPDSEYADPNEADDAPKVRGIIVTE